MIYFDLIESLYNKLPLDRQQHLLLLLFNGKHTIGYLKEKGKFSFSQQETLSDFFHMPMENFRADNSL